MKTGITVLLSILFTGTLYAQQAAVNKTDNNTSEGHYLTAVQEYAILYNGKKDVTIPFTTSDLSGEYLISVEGIGKNGTVANGTYKIKVDD